MASVAARVILTYPGARRSSITLKEMSKITNYDTPTMRKEKIEHDLRAKKLDCLHARICYHIAYGDYEPIFGSFMLLIILLAGALVGIQSYEHLEQNETLKFLDNFVLITFSVEILIKILAEGARPWGYLIGNKEWKWNLFDLIIVILSLPWITFAGSLVYLLRLVRLARLAKLFRKIPQLRMIIVGLIEGVKSITYILLLLFLVFYIYAVAGVYAFGENDPFHFRTVKLALVSLFQACTFDNWSDIMYIDIYGCDVYTADLYITDVTEMTGTGVDDELFYCRNPKKSYFVGPLYWISFIIISIIIIALFVGTITMSMSESMDEMKREYEQEKRESRRKVEEQKIEALKSGDYSKIDKKTYKKFKELRSVFNKIFEFQDQRTLNDSLNTIDDNKPRSETFVRSASQSSVDFNQTTADISNIVEESHLIGADVVNSSSAYDDNMSPIGSPSGSPRLEGSKEVQKYCYSYYILSLKCADIVKSKLFENTVTVVIILAGVTVGAETYEGFMALNGMTTLISTLNNIILTIFIAEIIFKVVSLYNRPYRFFYSGWNTFDFIVVLGSVIPSQNQSLIPLLRLLRLFRVLKLLKALPQLAIIVEALIDGVKSIGFIGIILLMVFYVFAIVGVMLFSENDQYNFRNLHTAMLTLVEIITLSSWGDIMYKNIYGCDVYEMDENYNNECKNPQRLGFGVAAYFMIFDVIGSWVLLSLFIGAITASMDEANENHERAVALDKRLLSLKDEVDIDEEVLDLYKKAFKMLDVDNSDSIEIDEIKIGLATINIFMNDAELKQILTKIDEGHEGITDLTDFIYFLDILRKQIKAKNEKRDTSVRNSRNNSIAEPTESLEM